MIARRAARVLLLALPALLAAAEQRSSCMACHGILDGDTRAPVEAWGNDVHALAGLGCESCHGGDASPALTEDADAAMNPKKGFRPPPDRLHVPDLCARCHADAEFMKRYDPKARVDQLVEYRTSVHGRLNAKGDPVPATCIDCHGVHGIRPISSPDSPAYATNVPKTCAKCHADAKRMAPYGIRTDQYERYRHSVHAAALLDRGDTAAPACNDCHGNHGASPPGVTSVAHVCGQCHGREGALFQASFKKELFDGLDVGECTVCHDNHGIRHPTPELFHGASAPEVSAGTVTSREPFSADLGDLAGGERRHATWRVVLQPHLPPDAPGLVHHVEVTCDGTSPLRLDATVRPGSTPEGVSQATTNGLTATLSITGLSGVPVDAGDALALRLEVVAGAAGAKGVRVGDLPGDGVAPVAGSACRTCHEPGDACDVATEKMYGALSTLDQELRQAASVLHRAEVAGMEVSAPRFELKSKGATAAIEARALVHSFDPDRLVARTAEGRSIAGGALAAGRGALAELQFRRKGLAASLLLVALVLLGLYLKIREVDRRRKEEARSLMIGRS
ncbi:MAG TPA: cytochrome c3 family protein [Candidatus Polarisedimenticolaceae bacterium]|nr:cytochrome c3 family protein [Candidatus Polarisedimenticolaceae bacterium]